MTLLAAIAALAGAVISPGPAEPALEYIVSLDPAPDAADRLRAALRRVGAADTHLVQSTPSGRASLVRLKRSDALSLAREPGVIAVEPNGMGCGGGAVVNDPRFAAQWHHARANDADVDTPEAWALETGSASVVIAVLDTGIDPSHPEFVGRIAPGGFDFVNEDATPNADHPHGIWVTGMAIANANNAFQGAGVDRAALVVPIKVLNADNAGTTFDLIQGLEHAAGLANVDIINLSLINYPGSASLRNAVTLARNSGKIVIACGGNGGIGNADVSFPGAFPNVITVGMTTNTNTRASNSGTGAALDFVAPGFSVVTTGPSTSSATETATVSGCSFATPLTAGVTSLLLARAERLGLSLTHDEIYDLLAAGADDLVGPATEDTPGRDNFFGHGRISAAQSLLALDALYDCDRTGIGDPLELTARTDTNGDGVLDRCQRCSPADLAAAFGVLDVNDVLGFASAFAAGDIEADLFPGGSLDVNDVLTFATLFVAGCP